MHNEENDLPDFVNEYFKLTSAVPNPVKLAFSTYKMSVLGKLYFASMIVSMLTGKQSPFKVSGDPQKVNILTTAIQNSKRFQQEINRPGATVDSVIRAMDLKNLSTKNFEKTFGVKFPL